MVGWFGGPLDLEGDVEEFGDGVELAFDGFFGLVDVAVVVFFEEFGGLVLGGAHEFGLACGVHVDDIDEA